MFAPPPPPQLSVAEVKQRLAEQRAAGVTSPTAPSPSSSKFNLNAKEKDGLSRTKSKSSSISSIPSITLKRSKGVNLKSSKKNATKSAAAIARDRDPGPPPPPPPVPPPSTPPPRTPPPAIPDCQRFNEIGTEKFTLPVFEGPRQAPRPPKRPPRPPSELFLPSPPGASRYGQVASGRVERAEVLPPLPPPLPPPPIPDKSPLRQVPVIKHPEPLRPRPLFTADVSPPNSAPTTIPGPMHRLSPSKLSVKSTTPSKRSPQPHSGNTEASFNAALAHMKARARRDSGSSSISLHSTSSSFVDRIGALGRIGRSATAPPGTLARMSGKSSISAVRSGLLMGSGASARGLQKSKHVKKSSIGSARSLDTSLARAAAAEKQKGPPSQRVAAVSDIRAALLQLDDSRREKKRWNAVAKPIKPVQPMEAQTRGKRRKKGETMSMLLDGGFFPIEEIIYQPGKTGRRVTSKDYRINLPLRLSFLNGGLPRTPGSNPLTPSELFAGSPSPTTPTTPKSAGWNRRSGASKRSPLAQIPENDSKANSGGLEKVSDQVSPSRLDAIPEDENSPRTFVVTVGTPVATEIHLRGGSVVTVTPPELTAWKPAVYLHGAIKLPTPAIMPRKNSVASMEAFQEAIDKMYQHALHIPRRRSDDAVVDDICDFFDEFGFEWVSFEGDKLVSDAMDLDEVQEMTDPDAIPERFTAPPLEQPAASPVEVTIAKEVLETTTKRTSARSMISISHIVVPPIENAETLRAKGIARLSRGSASSRGSVASLPTGTLADRKDSLTLSGGASQKTSGSNLEMSAGLPLHPAPEESMLEAVLQAGRGGVRNSSSGYTESLHNSRRGSASVSGSVSGSLYSSSGVLGRSGGRGSASVAGSQRSGGDQGFDWDDDVEEIDSSSSWVAPVAVPKKGARAKDLSRAKTRNPVSKMRRFIATASTTL